MAGLTCRQQLSRLHLHSQLRFPACQPNHGAGDTINKLPAELLLSIFDRLKPVQQVTVLPRVCKRWREMLTGPAFTWPHLTLEYRKPADPDQWSRYARDT